MIPETMFEFIGDPENDSGYVVGSEYPLEILERTIISRVLGIPFGLPFNWKIMVIKPLVRPYKSKSAFDKDWKLKFVRFSDE